MAIMMTRYGLSTVFLEEKRKIEEERNEKIRQLDIKMIEDAQNWRMLPENVKRNLIKKYLKGE